MYTYIITEEFRPADLQLSHGLEYIQFVVHLHVLHNVHKSTEHITAAATVASVE